MILEDKIIIAAHAPRVWAFLLDPERVASCMPGVDEVTQIDDRTFDGRIGASIGPISGEFLFRAHILESDPPREMRAEVKGTDSVTRSAIVAEMAMALDPLGADQTELAYRAQVDVQGRLAILGEMVLRATAVQLVEEFARRVRLQLESNDAGLPP